MRASLLFLSTALISTNLIIAPAQAQTVPAANENRAAIARMEVRFSALEERLRQMQGKIEEVDFENRRLREKLDLFQQDAELRFSDLEGGVAPNSSVTPVTPEAAPKPTPTLTPAPQPTQAATASPDKQVLRMPDRNKNFDTSREHYNYAFRLLNQTQYAEAGESFESFIQNYPSDPLLGNAYYWAGETYYVRQNYVQAADYFRRGYEALPTGPKAGDNLLKLAMSLSALDRNTESCVVLKQVTAKFGGNSSTLRNKSETERNRIGCR